MRGEVGAFRTSVSLFRYASWFDRLPTFLPPTTTMSFVASSFSLDTPEISDIALVKILGAYFAVLLGLAGVVIVIWRRGQPYDPSVEETLVDGHFSPCLTIRSFAP